MAIVPFESDVMNPELGIAVGRMFEQAIAKKACLRNVIMIEDVPWNKQLTERARKIQAALSGARQKNADLLLWGQIEEFEPGTVSRSRAALNVMLLDVRSATLVWWGRNASEGMPGNSFFFWGHRPAEESPPVSLLLEKAAVKISDAMFADAAGSLTAGRLLQGLLGGRASSASAPHDTLQEQTLSEQAGHEGTEPRGADVQAPTQEKDILDSALEELDSIAAE